jgi:hypothetical protein
MKQVTAYGLSTYDFIYRIKGDEISGAILFPNVVKVGGVYNFLRVLEKSSTVSASCIREGTDPLPIIILPNGKKLTLKNSAWSETSFSSVPKSDWHHLMYLDTCGFNFDSFNDGIISADVVSDLNPYMDILPKLDFLFISLENASTLLKEAGKLVKQAIILHSSDGVAVVKNGIITDIAETERIENINCIGAGDYLAAFFAEEYLLSNDITQSAINAKDRTSLYLKENQQWDQ